MLVKRLAVHTIYLQIFLRYSDISAASREVNERFIAFLPHQGKESYLSCSVRGTCMSILCRPLRPVCDAVVSCVYGSVDQNERFRVMYIGFIYTETFTRIGL